MDLTEALDVVYGHTQWNNPLRPSSISGIEDTPYEAFQDLKPEFRVIVVRLIGHQPAKEES